jgi:CheY-like chemotaxis protein
LGSQVKRENPLEKKPFILYVDDDPDDRDLFSYALTRSGAEYDLVTAEDGFDALRILNTGEKPSCLYVDVNMPGMTGMELLKILKSDMEFAPLPVFIFSTAVDPKSMKEARRLGAADVIIKPTSFQALIDHLQSSFTVPT